MKEQEIDGVIYVPRAELEASFKDRLAKLSAKASTAEDRATELQTELDGMAGKLGALDTLQQQIDEYRAQLDTANTRYERHSAIAAHGLTDPDLRDAVEWAYDRAMSTADSPLDLGEWLTQIKADPSSAPSVLRPHLSAAPVEAQGTEGAEQPQPAEQQAPALLPPRAPSTNRGAQPAPTGGDDLFKRAATDLDFYRQNREAIKSAWSKR